MPVAQVQRMPGDRPRHTRMEDAQLKRGVMADNDTVTLEDIIEKLGHLNASAKRQADTVYYARAHARINDALDLLEFAQEMERA